MTSNNSSDIRDYESATVMADHHLLRSSEEDIDIDELVAYKAQSLLNKMNRIEGRNSDSVKPVAYVAVSETVEDEVEDEDHKGKPQPLLSPSAQLSPLADPQQLPSIDAQPDPDAAQGAEGQRVHEACKAARDACEAQSQSEDEVEDTEVEDEDGNCMCSLPKRKTRRRKRNPSYLSRDHNGFLILHANSEDECADEEADREEALGMEVPQSEAKSADEVEDEVEDEALSAAAVLTKRGITRGPPQSQSSQGCSSLMHVLQSDMLLVIQCIG